MSRAIFHAHTNASHDAMVQFAAIAQKLIRLKIDTLFITDHNVLTQPKHIPSGLNVIHGEEIDTKEGEIIGIFLKEEIPPGLTLAKTIREIHRQRGLAVAPHPFDRLRSKVLPKAVLNRAIDTIDIVEVFNARTVFPEDNNLAMAYAKDYDKPIIFGSDAHTLMEYGLTWMENIDTTNSQTLVTSLKEAKTTTRLAPLYIHGVTKYVKWQKRNTA